jgi:uncharacterized protein
MRQAAALPTAPDRLLTLDVIRGVAVMGILLANIAAFSLPEAAYFSPLAWGGTGPADIAAWLANFVLVEGKMRGLFSFLFGASMLLVIDRAEGAGRSPARVHFSRLGVLFLIGIAHLYLVWWGDILAHYALVGAVAFLFVRLDTRQLVAAGLVCLLLSLLTSGMGLLAMIDAADGRNPAVWNSFATSFGVPARELLVGEVQAMRSAWVDQLAWRWKHASGMLAFLAAVGPETLSAMLLGMAGFRSGFLTGGWERARYRRWTIVTLAIALPAYALLGAATIRSGFDQRWVFFGSLVGSVPFRVLAVAGYSALIILAVRPGGWLTERVAAVGRTAFSNYLGTSALVTAMFYGWGLGQFGQWSRASIFLVPPVVFGVMLAWSRPWLQRFHYGPLEWFWRSASRLELAPMSKQRLV